MLRAILLGLVVLLSCAVILPACGPQRPSGVEERAPESAAGLARSSVVTGREALDEINRLHGKGIDAIAGVIASYGPGGDHGAPVTAWISRAASPGEAERQERVMLELMRSNPRSPFREIEPIEMDGTRVAAFSGMGVTHLVFIASDLVYWISAEPELARAALADFLAAAP